MQVGELHAKLRLDDSDFHSGLNEAQGNLGKLGSAATTAGKVAVGALAGLGVAAVGAAGQGIRTFANFEAAMNNVAAVSGATGDEFQSLEDQAKELGRTTQFSATQAADAMGFLAMAGFEANDIMGAMPGTLQLAAAANMDLASAADTVSNILTGYGKDVEDLAHVNDVLVATMTNANVDLNMLGESMKFVGPIASSVGVEFEEAAAAVGLLGNAGIQGSMAGTSLRGAISRLINPTEQAAGLMEELGITAMDAEGNFVGFESIVRQLEDSGANTAQMMSLFGDRAGPAMAALVDQGADALADLTKELEESGGTAERIAGVQMEGLLGAWKQIQSAAEGLFIEIGQNLAPSVQRLADTMLEHAPRMAEALTPVITAIGEGFVRLVEHGISFAEMFVNRVLPKLRDFASRAIEVFTGTILPAILGFIEAVVPRLQSFADWFLDSALPVIQDFASQAADFFTGTLLPAIQNALDEIIPRLQDFAAWFQDSAIPAALEAIGDAFSGLLEAAQPVFDWIRDNKDTVLAGLAGVITAVVIPAMAAWTLATWASVAAHIAAAVAWMAAYAPIIALVAAVGVAVGALYYAWTNNLGGIQEKTQAVWDAVRPVLQAAWDRLQQFADVVLPELKGAWETLQSAIRRVVDYLWNSVIKPTFAAIQGFIEDHGDTIIAVLEGAWEIIESTVSTAVDIIEGIIVAALKLIQGDWEGAWDAIKGALDSAWEHIQKVVGLLRDFVVEAISILASRTWETISGWKDDIISAAGELFAQVTSWVGSLKDTVIEYIADMASETWSTVSGWVSDVIGGARDLYNDVTSFVADLRDDVIQFFVDLVTDAWDSWSGLVSDVVNAAAELVSDVMAEIEALPGRIMEVFADAGTWLLQAGKDIINGLIDGIKSMIPDLDVSLGDITGMIPNLKGPPVEDARLLTPAGQKIMQGLITGIESQEPPLERTLGSITDRIEAVARGARVHAMPVQILEPMTRPLDVDSLVSALTHNFAPNTVRGDSGMTKLDIDLIMNGREVARVADEVMFANQRMRVRPVTP
jgi:TP901 family phage tail tape measure protein